MENWGSGKGGAGGVRERRGTVSVVIHFEDTAFDDAHVSVPHNLVSEGQKTETELL